MNVYVASQNKNRVAVRVAHKLLIDAGFSIGYDWTIHSIEGMTDRGEIDIALTRFAEMDFAGVVRSDALILLACPGMCATLTEFGIALAYGKKVVVVDAGREGCVFNIFYRLPQVVHVATVESAVLALRTPALWGSLNRLTFGEAAHQGGWQVGPRDSDFVPVTVGQPAAVTVSAQPQL